MNTSITQYNSTQHKSIKSRPLALTTLTTANLVYIIRALFYRTKPTLRKGKLFKSHAIKKYGAKLMPVLVNSYGAKKHYSPSEVRSTVYHNNFNPKYLPLAYLLCLEQSDLKNVLFTEYPELDIELYRKEISAYIVRKNYSEYFQRLSLSLNHN